MCNSKQRSDGVEPTSSTPRSSRSTKLSHPSPTSRRFVTDPSTSSSPRYAVVSSYIKDSRPSSSSSSSSSSSTSISTRTSLSTLRYSLPQNTLIFDFSEICSATNNFLAGKLSSSATWRCSVRGRDVVVFQRKPRRPIDMCHLYKRLSFISRAHHSSLIKLVGASISGDHLYLVYDYVHGSNLSDCLRNPKNPNFTVLSTWISRMQIATDVAHGLDYIHNCASSESRLVHNRIKSSSVIITEPSFNAKICHMGTAKLLGETSSEDDRNSEITEMSELDSSQSTDQSPKLIQSKRFEGTRGYMSPEFKTSGDGTQKSDVFAFGVVMLELLSGEEPLKYEFDDTRGCYRRVSVIETAREAFMESSEGRDGWVRRWVDKRLRDSFPVGVAREMTRVALECVEVDPSKRPGMGRVAGKVSKLYVESKIWSDKMGVHPEVTVSFVAR